MIQSGGENQTTVLVTGTGGFVGGRLVEALYLSNFAGVRAGIRRWANASRVARFPVSFVPCDIMEPAQIAAAVEDVTAVVHCAYTNERSVIVEGTRHMLEAAWQADARRFVYLSTAEVYGPEATGLIDEQHPCVPSGRVYGDAKIEAEQLVGEYHRRGLPTVILRPSIIYGPFGQSWTIDLATRLQSGNWGVFEGLGEGICNLVYVDDLIRAIFLALTRDAAVGEVFNVVGPDRITWNEYFRRFNEALDLPSLPQISTTRSQVTSAVRDRVNTVTRFFVNRFEDQLMRIYLRGGPLGQLMKRVKTRLKTTPTAKELGGLYSRRAEYTGEKARELLGFEARYDLSSGLQMCRPWLAYHGYLPESAAPAEQTA